MWLIFWPADGIWSPSRPTEFLYIIPIHFFPFYLMSFPIPAIELNLACSVKFQSNIALRAKGSVFVSSDHRISLNQIVAFPIRLRQTQGDSSFLPPFHETHLWTVFAFTVSCSLSGRAITTVALQCFHYSEHYVLEDSHIFHLLSYFEWWLSLCSELYSTT